MRWTYPVRLRRGVGMMSRRGYPWEMFPLYLNRIAGEVEGIDARSFGGHLGLLHAEDFLIVVGSLVCA